MAVVDEARPAPKAALGATRGGKLWLDTPDWQLMTVAPEQASLFAQFHRRNGEHFRFAMNLDEGMTDEAFWVPELASQERSYREGKGLFLVGYPKRAPDLGIGCAISFAGIVQEEFECCWLGYRLDRSLEGMGLMQAAVAPAIQAVIREFKLHRIMASHQPENLRSARLLRTLGFGIEGYARDFMRVNGAWRDNVLVSLIAPDSAA